MESLTLPATLDSLEHVSACISEATARAGMDEHTSWQVQLAVDEAATNIIQHGYSADAPGSFELSWRIQLDTLVITLRDWGRRFDPEDVPAPNVESPLEERQPGGLGLFLMNRLMDSIRFEFDDQRGNLLTMAKRIAPQEAPVKVFVLSGRLDAVHTGQALDQVKTAIAAGDHHVLLDMAGVTFLSSSGLRALLLLRRELLAQHGELKLCALQRQVREVFILTGFIQVFAIFETREEALAAFEQGPA